MSNFDFDSYINETCKDIRWTPCIERTLPEMSGRLYGIWLSVMTTCMALKLSPKEIDLLMGTISLIIGFEFNKSNSNKLAVEILQEYLRDGHKWLQQK